ncbi:unnamed protein product [Ectocarpus sp. CCAP 1310/34]|nr:unnamed protein product [Ectocarpus sp. CCAP 1310/34]
MKVLFNQSVVAVKWPEGLLELDFGLNFNMPIEGTSFPQGLRSICLGRCFNQDVTRVSWPEKLTRNAFIKVETPQRLSRTKPSFPQWRRQRDVRCLLLVANDAGSKPAAHLVFFRSTEKEKRWVGQETMHCLSNSKLLAIRGGSGAPATRTEDCWKKR